MNLPTPNKLVLRSGQAVAENWKSFHTQWRNYEVATGLCKKQMEVRVATFLCVIREEGIEKYKSFKLDEEEDKNNIEKIIEKFTLDSEARTNTVIERN